MEEEVSDWQPIETAPKDGTIILMTDGFFVQLAWRDKHCKSYPWIVIDDFEPKPLDDDSGTNYIELNGAKDEWATHWMPLPEPPKATQ